MPWPPVSRSRIRITVVKAVTTSSTNITGFFIISRGLSLMNAEPIAGTTILGLNSDETGKRLRKWEVSIELLCLIRWEKRTGVDRQLLDDWTERECRKEG
jgi:hypothetical protein